MNSISTRGRGSPTLRFMEFMDLSIRKVEQLIDSPLWVTVATASSRERLAGLPVASIQLQVRFVPKDGKRLTERMLREQARDELLRFLDVA